LKRPLLLALLLAFGIAAIASVLGGALGAAFGLGFLGSPIPDISVPGEKVIDIGGYELINSSILFWVAGLILITIAYFGTRRMEMVPTGLQNFVEMLVELFIGLTESVGGSSARRFLPLVMTIFLVIVLSNWLGILPGVGTIGRVESVEEFVGHELHDLEAEIHEQHPELSDAELHEEALTQALKATKNEKMTVFDGSGSFLYIPFGRGEATKVTVSGIVRNDHEHAEDDLHSGTVIVPPEDEPDLVGKETGILIPFLRGPNTDLNTTLAIAIVAMIAIQFWGVRTLGLRGYGGKFINLKNGPIHFAVGLLEIISEVSRLISFTFRLFGNMFAGEILLVAMGFLFPLIGIIPFMGLELFVGAIQGFIFAMLTLVFAVVATSAHGEEGH
jgi:F-type H+-transporting ATPase subunit a